MKFYIFAFALIAAASADVSHLVNNKYLPPVGEVVSRHEDITFIEKHADLEAPAVLEEPQQDISDVTNTVEEYHEAPVVAPSVVSRIDVVEPAAATVVEQEQEEAVVQEQEQEAPAASVVVEKEDTFTAVVQEQVQEQEAPAASVVVEEQQEDEAPVQAPVVEQETVSETVVEEHQEVAPAAVFESRIDTVVAPAPVVEQPVVETVSSSVVEDHVAAPAVLDSVAQYVSSHVSSGIDTQYGENGGYVY